MDAVEIARIRNTLWQAIRDYAEAVSMVETMQAVHQVFVDNEARELERHWNGIADGKRAILDALIETVLLCLSKEDYPKGKHPCQSHGTLTDC